MCLFFCSSKSISSQESIYEVKINSISGELIDFTEFKGKFILIVNVASECGFTKQYTELEELHQLYKDKLVVIGVPCNQFGEQEPGTSEEIIKFCQDNFGVTFLLTEKIKVKGEDKHPLYKWLCTKELNGKSNSTVKWNFQKYLVDKNGEFINYFFSTTKPLNKKVTSYFTDQIMFGDFFLNAIIFNIGYRW